MKKFWPLIVVAVGILLIVSSAGYGVFFVGIPGPDDSPAELARQSMQGNFAVGGGFVGVLCLLIGVVAGIIRLVSRKRQSQT